MVAAQSQPPSYDGSFNPFPALVIGVTGLAMAAHAQNIEYERVIHVVSQRSSGVAGDPALKEKLTLASIFLPW